MLNEDYHYKVQFAHDNENAENDATKHGVGLIDIRTDEPIKTQEQLKEVARSIGKTYGFTSVAIIAITGVGGEDVNVDGEVTHSVEDEIQSITSLPAPKEEDK